MRKKCNVCRSCSNHCNVLIGRQIHCLDCLPYSHIHHKTTGSYPETARAQTRRITSGQQWNLLPSHQVVKQCADMPLQQMQGWIQNCHCIHPCTFSMVLSSKPTAAMTAKTTTVTTCAHSIRKEKQISSSVDSLPCKKMRSWQGCSHQR